MTHEQTIGLVYDLRSDYLELGYTEEQVAEFDSPETIEALQGAIRSCGFRTERIGNAKTLVRRLVDGARWDLVFNIAEGLWGRSREAQVPAILELYDIPYTFSDPLICALTLDKAAAKGVVRGANIRTPKFNVVQTLGDVDRIDLEYPLFAKPLAEGTGKGVDGQSHIRSPQALQSICRNLLDRFAQPVLIEEFLPGREFTVGILGTNEEAFVLGTLEIKIEVDETYNIYSLETKEKCESQVLYQPLSETAVRKKLERTALQAYRALQCRDAGRVDLRLDRNGQPSFLELNALPGLHPTHSDLPMIATDQGMPYVELIGTIIQSALSRARKRHAA